MKNLLTNKIAFLAELCGHKWLFPVVLGFVTVFCASEAFPHAGGLDREGCHTENRTGEYHCHGNPREADQVESLSCPNYDRGHWGGWRDADGDCLDTRQEVLEKESVGSVTFSADGCKVISGKWKDPYSGKTFTNPEELHIDHLVPLKEAHVSGGCRWGKEKKRSYANDLSSPATLIAVSSRENSSKGAKDPAEWLPSNRAYHCEYVRLWKKVKTRWGLRSDNAESQRISEIEEGCP